MTVKRRWPDPVPYEQAKAYRRSITLAGRMRRREKMVQAAAVGVVIVITGMMVWFTLVLLEAVCALAP